MKLLLLVILTPILFIGYIFYHLKIYPAKKSANDNVYEVALFFGFLKIVFWEENEAILIGRRKKVVFDSSNHPTHNELFIYPVLGDQVLARVKRGSELLIWKDAEKTPTKEGIRVRIDMTLRWRISNLKNYLYEINRPNIGKDDSHRHLKEVTNLWLSKTLETEIRKFLRKLTVGQIISFSSKEITHSGESTDNIAQKVKEIIRNKLNPYGIEVENVEISDIQFEKRIQDAIDDIKIAILKQEKSWHEGQAMVNELQPLIDSLGKEGVILIEAFKNMKGGGMFFAPPQFANLMNVEAKGEQPKVKQQISIKETEFKQMKTLENQIFPRLEEGDLE